MQSINKWFINRLHDFVNGLNFECLLYKIHSFTLSIVCQITLNTITVFSPSTQVN